MWCSSKYCNPAMGGMIVGGDKQPPNERIIRINNLKIQSKLEMFYLARLFIYKAEFVYLIVEGHATQLFWPDEIIMAGLDILKTEEEHQNIKTVDSSVCYNAYTLLKNWNMWYETNILKIHLKGMATFKKKKKN